MAAFKLALLFVVVFALNAGFTSAAIDVQPINDAVLVGSTVRLDCSVYDPSFSRVMWYEFASNPGGTIVSDNRTVAGAHPNRDRYSIIGVDPYFILEIRDVQLSDGGTYMCQDIYEQAPNLIRASAELIVLESDPVCIDPVPADGAVIEGTYYAVQCRVNFQGNMVPNVRWNGPGVYLTNSTSSTTSVIAIAIFTARREVESFFFSCETNFTGRLASPGVASNPPSYTYTYTGPAFNVSWGPSPVTIEITPIKTFYEIGDVLTCSADSKPDSAYTWLNLRTFETFSGQTFTVTADLEGTENLMRCNAFLSLDQQYTADAFQQVDVPVTTTPGPTTTTTRAPNPLDCSDVTGRWRSTNPNADLCLEVTTSGSIFSLIRNGTDSTFIAGNGETVYNDNKHIGFTGIWPGTTGVAGFVGECHACLGTETILVSGLFRSIYRSHTCGQSDGTDLTRLYVFTRVGPPCRGQPLAVHPSQAWIAEKMGVIVRNV